MPTRDIHMKQVGMEEQWLEFLRAYVKPLVENEFVGFQSDVSDCFPILKGNEFVVEGAALSGRKGCSDSGAYLYKLSILYINTL